MIFVMFSYLTRTKLNICGETRKWVPILPDSYKEDLWRRMVEHLQINMWHHENCWLELLPKVLLLSTE